MPEDAGGNKFSERLLFKGTLARFRDEVKLSKVACRIDKTGGETHVIVRLSSEGGLSSVALGGVSGWFHADPRRPRLPPAPRPRPQPERPWSRGTVRAQLEVNGTVSLRAELEDAQDSIVMGRWRKLRAHLEKDGLIGDAETLETPDKKTVEAEKMTEEQYWTDVIKQAQASGNVRRYLGERGLPHSTFYDWKGRLKL